MEIMALNAGYREIPVDIDTFIEDDRFLGKSTDNGRLVYPGWRRILRECFPDPFTSPYDLIVLTGCIGAGKSTFAKIASSYCMHKFLCIENPHRFYSHVPTTEYLHFTFSPVAGTGADIIENEMWLLWKESSWFQDLLIKNGGYLPHRAGTGSGSRPSANVGRAIFCSVCTEVNFSGYVSETLNPMAQFNSIYRRMESRFLYKGRLPYPAIIDSSISDDNDMVSTLKKNFKKAKMRVFEFAIWEIKDRSLYSDQTFEVFCGDDKIDPFIITPEDPTGQIVKASPETSHRVIQVPMDFYASFTSDLRTSIRDIAGVATASNSQFITNAAALNAAFDQPNPITKQIIRIGIAPQYKEVSLSDYFEPEYWSKFVRVVDDPYAELDLDIKRLMTNEKLNKVHTEAGDTRPRSFHVDLGLVNDKTGIGCTLIDRYVKILRSDPVTGETSIYNEPVYLNEWVMYVGAAPNDEVPIYKVRDFFIDLRTRGVNVWKITCDGYQSRQLMQELTVAGFNVEYLSVDRSKDAYLALKRSILESRYHTSTNHRLLVELKELIDTRDKIDHPESGELGDGSKDGADCAAGSLWSLVMNEGSTEIDDASDQYDELADIYGELASNNNMKDIMLNKMMR